jgi:hypothetical protein
VSIKELVRRTGLSRNTIRAALRSDEPPTFEVPERPSKIEPFRDEIHRLLSEDPKLPAFGSGSCSTRWVRWRQGDRR